MRACGIIHFAILTGYIPKRLTQNKCQSTPAKTINISNDWSFVRRRVDADWLGRDETDGATVDLPHSWNETDTFQRDVTYYQGDGAYRKSCIVPENPVSPREPHRWHLVSEGFYGVGDVWLNGTRVDEVDGQYLGFRLDVTAQVLPGRRNVVGMRLDNSYHPFVLPGKKLPDFLLHGGMAGRVCLQRIPVLSIEPHSLRILCADPLAASPALFVTLSVRNLQDKPRSAALRCCIHDDRGATVHDAEQPALSFHSGLNHSVAFSCILDSPRLWDLHSPNLYTVTCSLRDGDTTIHDFSARTGIREVEFRPHEGFTLNGERTELMGANRHESMPGFGNALPGFIHRMDAELFKSMGLNLVRLSHYPQSTAFLDSCDELGILVYAEIATWKSIRPGPWQRAACRQMKEMILRDRNRPSIVLWGMGNESRSRLVFNALRRIVDKHDPGRSTIYAENHLHRGQRGRTLKQPDVLGLNYERDQLDDARDLSRNGSLLISEMSNCPHAYRGELEAEIEQVDTIERALSAYAGKAFVTGTCLWSFNDYATLRKQRYFRCCGVVDAWRVPKLSSDYLKARTFKEPFISLHADWNSASNSRLRKVHVFTNCEEVGLLVGHRLVGTLQGKWHMQTQLDFEPSVLSARGIQGGKSVTDSIAPWGQSRQLALSPTVAECVAADRETTLIRCATTDANGQHVSDWSGEVAVSATGPVRVRFHTESSTVTVAKGLAHIFVTGTGEPGTVSVSATHAGLEPGKCTVRFS